MDSRLPGKRQPIYSMRTIDFWKQKLKEAKKLLDGQVQLTPNLQSPVRPLDMGPIRWGHQLKATRKKAGVNRWHAKLKKRIAFYEERIAYLRSLSKFDRVIKIPPI